LPGTDPMEAAKYIFDELGDLPHLAELPARGVGADMIGRSAIFLVDLPVQVEPSGWRFTSRPGRDLRQARDHLARDLDAVEQAGQGVRVFKVQAAGPLTLAASIELVTGHRAVSDPGAVREIAQSLAVGLAVHVAEIAKRLPEAQLVVQLDEPSIPAVLAAQIPTPSGYGTVRAVAAEVVETHLGDVLRALDVSARIVHCCASDVPIALFQRAGAQAVSLDVDRLDTAALDALGEAVDAGVSLWLGLGDSDGRLNSALMATRLMRLWDQLSFDPARLADVVVPTPTCGLAGYTPTAARAYLDTVREVGKRLHEHAG
jgi:methionine synthase II (cobalamin-independent)